MSFLKKIDHYLLTNHPILWRTKVHYFVLFSLILGNLVAFGLGYFLVEKYGAIRTEFLSLFILLVIGFLGLIWFISQVRTKIKMYNFWDEVLLFFLYIFCVGCLLSNSLIFEITTTYKTARLVSVEQIDRDYEILKRYYQTEDVLSDVVFKELPLASSEEMAKRYKVNNRNRENNIHQKTNQIYSRINNIIYLQRCYEMRRPLEIESLLCGVYIQPYVISISKYLLIWVAAFLSVFLLVHIKFRVFLMLVLVEFFAVFSIMLATLKEDYWTIFFVSFALLPLLIAALKLSDRQFSKQLISLFLIAYVPVLPMGFYYLNDGFYNKFSIIFVFILIMITPFTSASFIKHYFEPTT